MYADALDYDDPEDSNEHEQTAIDMLADVLHYLESIDPTFHPARLLEPAVRHYQVESDAQQEIAS